MSSRTALRKNGISVYLTIPIELARAFDLKPGDEVLFEESENGLKLKFPKVDKTRISGWRRIEAEAVG